jgi:hypothetical protein
VVVGQDDRAILDMECFGAGEPSDPLAEVEQALVGDPSRSESDGGRHGREYRSEQGRRNGHTRTKHAEPEPIAEILAAPVCEHGET